MEDIASKLAQMLDDPEGLNTIKSLAESIMADGNNPLSSLIPKENSLPKDNAIESTDLFSGVSPDQIKSIMHIMGALNNQQDDDRTRLLYSLRPYLSSKRQDRVDKAAKLLKLAAVLPLINESGLFKL